MKKSVIALGLMACSGLTNAFTPFQVDPQQLLENTKHWSYPKVCAQAAIYIGENGSDGPYGKAISYVMEKRGKTATQGDKDLCQELYQHFFVKGLQMRNHNVNYHNGDSV